MTQTIYTQEPGKYYVQKSVGGWVVVYIEDRHSMRNVDGGKLYPSRQNAYARAKRLNTALERALEKAGMAEAEYGSGYIANVQEEESIEREGYSLTLRQDVMPPFETRFFDTLDELKQYVKDTLPHPLNWHKVKPEAI